MKRARITAAFICAHAVRAWAQPGPPVAPTTSAELRDMIERRVEVVAEQLGEDSDADLTALFEILFDRFGDPLDLNRATPEEVAALQLLSDVQIAALQEHIREEGALLSIYELQAIDGFDPQVIELIRPFVTVRERTSNTRTPLREVLRLADHEFIVRSITDVQQRRGYQDRDNLFGNSYMDPEGDPLPDVNDPQVVDSLRRDGKVYLGSPYKLYTRYRFRYRQNISFGITAEKDEGEEFFQGSQSDGFDFYSAHLFVRDVGPLKSIAVGDFQAQFGQGLTYWSGFGYGGKSSYTMNIKRNAPGLLPYASVNENLFLRGVGATLALGERFALTAFDSNRKVDASLAAGDTLDTGEIEAAFSSFQEDGFHRTPNELAKKDALGVQSTGGHLHYAARRLSIGATAVHTAYDVPLERDLRPYNRAEFTGDALTNLGVDWNVLYRNLSWFGEVSTTVAHSMEQKKLPVAWLSGALVALDPRVSLSVLFRDYPVNYLGLHSVAFADGSHPWNERGFYTGLEVKASRQWTINAYFDQYRFPWLRYLVDAPSQGYEVLGQVNWKPSKKVEIYGRVRHREYQKNASTGVDGIDPLVDVRQTNWRFNTSARVSNSISLRTRVELVDYQRGEGPRDHGFLIAQDVVHRPMRSPVELTFRLALFQTDSYDARVYAYENDLTGLFSFPPYYDRGMRWYAMVRLTPLRRVDLWVRYGSWIWNDQNVYSSGLQEISTGPDARQVMRSDVKVQLRVTF